MRVIVHTVPDSPWLDYLRQRLPQLEVCPDRTCAPDRVGDARWFAYENYLDALALQGDDPAIQIEDDVILTRNFLEKAEAVIGVRPASIIQFFSMRQADREVGARWDRDFLSNLCTYIPAKIAPQLVAFGRAWERRAEHPGGYDLMVNDWLREYRQRYWIAVPNLVQHRIAKSRLGPRSSKRQSLTFVEPD